MAVNLTNWHFVADGAGYWNGANTRVFGHLWSIAVEERFYLWHWPVFLLLDEERLGLSGPPRTAVVLAVSVLAAWLSKVLVEDPVRFRARWATGRGGVLALVAAFAALAALWALWALIPEPRTGAGSVDVTRLMPADG